MDPFGVEYKMKEMEEEMNRFEQEISVQPMSNINLFEGSSRLQFVPHQLQRQSHPQHIHGQAGAATIEDPVTTFVSQGNLIAPPGTPIVAQSNSTTVIRAAPAVYAALPVRTKPKEEPLALPKVIKPPVTMVKPDIKLIQPELCVTRPPIAVPSVSKQVASAMSFGTHEEASTTKKERKKKKIIRSAGGQNWEDPSLLEWELDDFRIFCGDLGNDVTDEVLTRAFGKYPSFIKAKVVRDKRNNKTKGFGFVSFKDPGDFIRAMREMNAAEIYQKIKRQYGDESFTFIRVCMGPKIRGWKLPNTSFEGINKLSERWEKCVSKRSKYVGSRPIKLRKSTWKDRNSEVVKKKMKEKQRLGLR